MKGSRRDGPQAGREPQERWRRLNGREHLDARIKGVHSKDGINQGNAKGDDVAVRSWNSGT